MFWLSGSARRGGNAAHLLDASTDTGTGLRIIIDHGEYWLQNKGDLAMLDVTVGRLRERWPDARIGVPTFDPALLRSYEPGAEPLAVSEGGDWMPRRPSHVLAERLPARVVGPVTRGWRETTLPPRRLVRQLRSRLRKPAPQANDQGSWPESRPLPRIPRAVSTASLVLALGGGYLADVDRNQSHRTLDLFEQAAALGIPTAMLGQGIGPIEDPVLLARAREVLPTVDLIALREPVNGPQLLLSLGVQPERIVVTGDDAIELAYALRPERPGNGVGLTVRIAEYSPVKARATDEIAHAMQTFAAERSAPLVPMAVSTYLNQDRRAAEPLVRGYGDVVPMLNRYSSSRDLAARVARCAVVVTGAYHVAVFALSQGIPVITLSSSRYYDHKYVGLERMFGTGVTQLSLEDDDIGARLLAAMRAAWEAAPVQRDMLLTAAARQIEDSRSTLARVSALVAT